MTKPKLRVLLKRKWHGVWKSFSDIGIRSLKTAVQTFGGLVTVDALFDRVDTTLVFEAATAAAAAGASVVWNAVLAWSRS